MALGTFENFVCCVLFGASLSLITRSAAFGIAGGFGYLIGEDIAAQILPVVGKSVHTALGNQVVALLFTPNLNACYAQTLPPYLARTLDQLDGVIACHPTATGGATVSVTHALGVTVVWALILAGTATWLFMTRDITQ